jgi:colicin import membrane protein
MTTEIVKFDEVIQQSGLAIQEGEEIKQSYLPFAVQLTEVQDQAVKINFENPTPLDETIARELRLKTVKIRTGANDLKDSRKKIHLLKGNLEQAAYNLIAASCKLSEETFTTVEKAREIAEAKRKSELKVIRDAEILPFAEFVPFGMDLGKFSEEDYQKLLDGARLQMEQKREQERKVEAARIEAEQFRIAEEKRIREENERLKKEAEAKEKQLESEREKAEQDRKLAEDKARKEREVIEAKAEAERLKSIELARIEKEKADAILKTEREAKAKLEAELKVKAEAEQAEIDRLERERKAKELADKKAASAPDKQKLISLAKTISGIDFPEMKTIEGMSILDNVKELLKKTSEFITKKVGEI